MQPAVNVVSKQSIVDRVKPSSASSLEINSIPYFMLDCPVKWLRVVVQVGFYMPMMPPVPVKEIFERVDT